MQEPSSAVITWKSKINTLNKKYIYIHDKCLIYLKYLLYINACYAVADHFTALNKFLAIFIQLFILSTVLGPYCSIGYLDIFLTNFREKSLVIVLKIYLM